MKSNWESKNERLVARIEPSEWNVSLFDTEFQEKSRDSSYRVTAPNDIVQLWETNMNMVNEKFSHFRFPEFPGVIKFPVYG
jgi:hypothetical protein